MDSADLGPHDFPADLSLDTVVAIRSAIDEFRRPLAEHRNLVVKDLAARDAYVAILTKDLDLWKEVVGTIGGLGAVVPNLVAVAGGLVLLLYRMRRYQIRLTGLQGTLLLRLREFGGAGCTEAELFESLGIDDSHHEAAREALAVLQSAPAANRESKQLVVVSAGRLRANDV